MNISGGIFSIVQIVGYLAYGCTVIAFWQKKDRRFLLTNGAGELLWTLQYYLLHAWTGAAVELLVAVRFLLSGHIINHRHRHLYAFGFIAAFILLGAITYQHWYDVAVVIACVIGTIAMIYFKNFALRYGMLSTLFLWLLYGYCVGSIGEIIASSTLIIVQIITLVRMYRDKKSSLS